MWIVFTSLLTRVISGCGVAERNRWKPSCLGGATVAPLRLRRKGSVITARKGSVVTAVITAYLTIGLNPRRHRPFRILPRHKVEGGGGGLVRPPCRFAPD